MFNYHTLKALFPELEREDLHIFMRESTHGLDSIQTAECALSCAEVLTSPKLPDEIWDKEVVELMDTLIDITTVPEIGFEAARTALQLRNMMENGAPKCQINELKDALLLGVAASAVYATFISISLSDRSDEITDNLKQLLCRYPSVTYEMALPYVTNIRKLMPCYGIFPNAVHNETIRRRELV